MNGIIFAISSAITRFTGGERFRKATRDDYRLWLSFFAFFPICGASFLIAFRRIPSDVADGWPFWLAATVLGAAWWLLWQGVLRRIPAPLCGVIAIFTWVAAVCWFRTIE